MKRVLLLILSASILFSCCACASSLAVTEETATAGEEQTAPATQQNKTAEDLGPVTLPKGFSAGFGQEIASPQQGVGLGGYSTHDTRLSKRVLDDLKISAVALSDGESVFLLCAIDFLYVSEDILNSVTKRLEKKYDGITIAPENVMINASHTHAAPAIYNNAATVANYMKTFYLAFYRAVDEAMHDLAPATLSAGEARTENLNWVRRYVSLDGKTYLGNWPNPELQPTEARHETEADNQLQVLRFSRENVQDIVLVNWQCHTTTTGSDNGGDVSADWAGALRNEVEKREGVHCAFFQGAAGNLVPGSSIAGEKDNNRDHVKHGQEVAEVAIEALKAAKPVSMEPFSAKRIRFEATKKSGSSTSSFYLSAFSIGGVAFATAPCEYHDTLGMYVKDNSPFDTTFMCAYTNGNISYVPSAAAMEIGGYEPGKMKFEKGTGEKMAEKLVELLKEIKS